MVTLWFDCFGVAMRFLQNGRAVVSGCEDVTVVQLDLFDGEIGSVSQFSESIAELQSRTSMHRRKAALGVSYLTDATLAGKYEIPKMKACEVMPEYLVPFSEVCGGRWNSDIDRSKTFIHFYEHDEKFERIARNPDIYLSRLEGFAGFIAPDFSVYRNLPVAAKISATFKNFGLGAYMQEHGFQVIPNVRISGKESVVYTLAGVPQDSYLAVGLHGCLRDLENRNRAREELRLLVQMCAPIGLLVYGAVGQEFIDETVPFGLEVKKFHPPAIRSRQRKQAA